ncbi:MAG TPA: ABC transporter permease [Cyclobacteriaceae bacterium]|nr:ABC transporter permease [Cyclobacteriaceae bacterium]
MFKSYFTIGWRNLLRSKTHSFINIGGLAVGIASCFLIALYITDELNYDRYHSNGDRIQRVVMEDWAKMPAALAPALSTKYPHLVEQVVRFWPVFSPAKVRHDDVVFVESGIVFADPSVFSVFSWPLITGNPSKALTEKNSIVLTRSMATKYFGTEDPLDKSVKFWGEDLTVTGVMEDVPYNSHLKFDFLISFSTLQLVMGNELDENWGMPVFYTYILPAEGVSNDQLKSAIEELVNVNFSDPENPSLSSSRGHLSPSIALQPLTSIHLRSDLKAEFKPGGNISYLYILGTAALFILVLACINFTNLNTARATTRAREVGMRKTLGALKRQLVEQFFGEALLTCVMALLIALALVTMILPAFNQFAGKAIQLQAALTPEFIGGSIFIILLIGFCAGSYPALFLSRLKPVSSLKGSSGARASHPLVRKGLIVFQFMVSSFFLAGMFIVLLQLNYLQDKDLGFDRDQIIVLDGDGFPTLRTELRSIAGVEQVAGVPQVLPGLLPISRYRSEGVVTDSTSQMTHYGVTPGFIETMGIKLIAGRSFAEASQKDEQEAFVLNESAVRELGWDPSEAIGKPFSMFVPPLNGGSEVWRDGYITGVVQDFHHDALYKKVSPIVLYPSYDMNLTLVRIQVSPAVISSVQKAWTKVNPDAPFNYYFLDDRIRQQYESEFKLGTIMTSATAIAVIIACLGLLGLVSFTANQRTKEIGIRKVLGASSSQVVALLSGDFIKMVGLAAVLSLPIAYYVLTAWISNFAYHIEVSWVIFASAGLFTLIVAMLTVVLQSLKAAVAPPTESLRSE